MPAVRLVGTVASVLDTAREPGIIETLGPFDSVLAESQTAGRGQFRRQWTSPAGNIYAALRLPATPPFLGTEAAVALGAWMAEALASRGWPAFVKWPNDVVIVEGGVARKVCGILLEERAGVLLAGVGVNVASAPSMAEMRQGAAIPATCLAVSARNVGLAVPHACALWHSLVNDVVSFYTHNDGPSSGWLSMANRRLLWRGRRVELDDSGSNVVGCLDGVGSGGELVLDTGSGKKFFLSGSIRCCDQDCR